MVRIMFLTQLIWYIEGMYHFSTRLIWYTEGMYHVFNPTYMVHRGDVPYLSPNLHGT